MDFTSELEPIARKLEKLADAYGDTYYGKGAQDRSRRPCEERTAKLENPLASKGK